MTTMNLADSLRSIAVAANSSHKTELERIVLYLKNEALRGKFVAHIMPRVEHADAVLEELQNMGVNIVKIYAKVSERQEFIHAEVGWWPESAE